MTIENFNYKSALVTHFAKRMGIVYAHFR